MKSSIQLDERQASWKVLLPAQPENRILALGVSEAALCSLRRTFAHVETSLSCGKYDVVVLDCRNINLPNPGVIDSCANGDTVIVFINTDRKTKKLLKAKGYNYVRQYAGLPASQPRLYIPLGSARLRAKGLSFHKPGSLKAKVAICLAGSISRFGLKFHLMRNTISIFSTNDNTTGDNSLINWISGKVGYRISDLAVYGGSESDRRKITALAIAENGKDFVVKIADTKPATEAIKQETDALKDIAESALAGCVPKIIAVGFCGRYYVQVQEKLNTGGRQVSSLTDIHLDFLTELSRIKRRACLLKETSVWQKVKTQLENIDNLPPEVAVVARYVLSEEIANKKILCYRSHGDFAPWNISIKDGCLFVYDWEDSLPYDLAFTDIFHFVYRQASLVGPWPGTLQVLKNIINSSKKISENMHLDIMNVKLCLLLLCAMEYLNDASDNIIEAIDLLNKTKL